MSVLNAGNNASMVMTSSVMGLTVAAMGLLGLGLLYLFFGGDSGYGEVFSEIGKTYGPFDTALIGIGAYDPRPMMYASHATPEEAVQIGQDIRARRLVGMHWGTVVLTSEPPFEPPERFLAAGAAQGLDPENLWIMKIGETRPLNGTWPSNSI